jgi:hypothetical protein
MSKYRYQLGRTTNLTRLGEIKPLKKDRKSSFIQLSQSVKHKCKELEMYRILNWESNLNYQ